MKLTSRPCVTALVALLPVHGHADHPTVVFGHEHSGPITTISATTMPKGSAALGLRTENIWFDAFSDAELRSFAAQGLEGVHSVKRLTSTSVAFSYGLTDNFTVSIR